MRTKQLCIAGMCLSFSVFTFAVTTVITRHESGTDFIQGELDHVTVDSSGTLRLARRSQEIDCGNLLEDVWSIHTILAEPDGTLFLGTGPNARVIRYAGQRAEIVYPLEQPDANELSDSSILNEHIFALAKDVAGRLLIAVSGEKGKLIRLAKEPEVVFEDERVKYIFSMALDEQNNIYLGTGPEGLLFRLDPFCQEPEVIYDARDNSLLSLAIHEGTVYAGSDERGLVYRIDPPRGLRPPRGRGPEQQRATVLYDSEQDEVPALAVDSAGNVYAASTSAQAAMLQLKASGISLKKAPGRPDSSENNGSSDTSESLNTANNDESKEEEKEKPTPPTPAPPPAKVAGHIYKITPEGYVTDIFSEIAVFYSLLLENDTLYLGTGNKGQFFAVDPGVEESRVVFEDKTSSQVTSAVYYDGDVYLGLSNPARLIRLEKTLAPTGYFESSIIDAGQPAKWGKLQLEADIPPACRVTMASRSGNVKDPNDSTFSDWTDEKELAGAADLLCPVGRYCQYRLTLSTNSKSATPVVREVALAHVIPNLAPTVRSIKVERSRDPKTPNEINVTFMTSDDNKDDLEYLLEFRKAGRTRWILLEDELDKLRFQWDSRTVEDGRYEVRVTANDRKSNTPETTLTGSRISDVFVIDNTAPRIQKAQLDVQAPDVAVELIVADALSVLGKVRYTIDSNDKWITLLPDDLVYDTLVETFTYRIDDLDPGDHVIAFSVADDLENTRFKTYEITIP